MKDVGKKLEKFSIFIAMQLHAPLPFLQQIVTRASEQALSWINFKSTRAEFSLNPLNQSLFLFSSSVKFGTEMTKKRH